MPAGYRSIVTGLLRKCGSIGPIASYSASSSPFVIPSSGNSTFSGCVITPPAFREVKGPAPSEVEGLSRDLARGLVGADGEQPRVAQLAVRGPFDERDL